MGMYTKLHCNIKIKKGATECIEILKYMLGEKEKIDFEIPNHDLFKAENSRWEFMLKCCSEYFTGTNNSKLIDNNYNYVLHCDCDLKDYENEIELFLDWISQYSDYNDWYEFVGYEIYEEDKVPTLIYINKNGYKLIKLSENIIKKEVE